VNSSINNVKYGTNNLAHVWAVNPGQIKQQGGNIAKFSVDKNFHTTYWVANFFGLAND
jgi:hypothetical protein